MKTNNKKKRCIRKKKLLLYKKIAIFFGKKIYNYISVISTLAIFTSILIYILGKITHYYKTDDDLILDGIEKAIPKNYSVIEMVSADLHGMGNNSLIVVIGGDYDFDSVLSGEPNLEAAPRIQILIFDQINNGVLQNLYNLFGFGSNYILRYQFALTNDRFGSWYDAEIDRIIDLNGDGRPEISVNFYEPFMGSAWAYMNGIFSYSITDRKYHFIAYPNPDKDDDRMDDEFYIRYNTYYNYFDREERFSLSSSTLRDNQFFWDSGHGVYLIKTTHTIEGYESNAGPHTYYLYIYKAEDNKTGSFLWTHVYDGEIPGKRSKCTEQFLIDYILDNNLLEYNQEW